MWKTIRHRVGYWLLRMPQVTDDQRRRAVKAVRSQACVCGAEKLRGMAFCEGCHNKLKGHEQRRLSLMLRRGFVLQYLSLLDRKAV
jgi:CDGSH-type Zn-finger protein